MHTATLAGAYCAVPNLVLPFAAVALPLLLSVPSVPDAVFYNQLAALAGCGLWLAMDASGARALRAVPDRIALLAASAALLICAAFAAARAGLGQGAALGILLAGTVLLWRGARADAADAQGFAIAWWVAGVASVVIAAVQYFAPALADGWLVAGNSTPGRAIGNMRQPNHLSTALLCAVAMTAWLWQARRLRGGWAAASIVAMLFALALTASRTGALSLGVLLVWAALDRRLPRGARWTLALSPLIYLAFWAGLAAYADWVQTHFYAADRLHASNDISSSRFAIWRNALTLVAQNPWTGVGWGNFNFAWTFSPFPDRPVAFFDHTHNLPLNLAVEIGLPATAAVLGALAWALWRARGAWQTPQGGADPAGASGAARAALAMLALLAVHSQLEYPLWYAYFLLPAAWVLGLFLGAAPVLGAAQAGPAAQGAGSTGEAAVDAGAHDAFAASADTVGPPARMAASPGLATGATFSIGVGSSAAISPATAARATGPRATASRAGAALLRVLGVAMLAGAAYAAWDHRRVEVIFAPPAGAAALEARIAEGQRSVLFGHHADYAAVTTEPRDTAPASFRRPLHQLIDVRLLAAYMEALHVQGREPEALYAAQRLREFRRDDAQAWFERCTPDELAPPWQCDTRPVSLDWRALDP